MVVFRKGDRLAPSPECLGLFNLNVMHWLWTKQSKKYNNSEQYVHGLSLNLPKHLDSSDSIRSDLKVVIQPSLPRREGRNNAIPFCVFFVKKNVHHFAIFAKDSLIDRAKVGIKSDKAAPLVINFVKRCDKKNVHIYTSFLCNI